MDTSDTVKILKENGLKYIDKRKDMLNIFVEEDKYISARYMQRVISENYFGILSDAIYRNLHLLKGLGIIENTELDGETKFRIACTDHHHHHPIHEKCEDTKVVSYYPMDQIKLSLPGANVRKRKLEIYGVCESYRD